MQVRKLIKELQKIQDKYGPTKKVHVNASKYNHWHHSWDYDVVSNIAVTTCMRRNPETGGVYDHGQEVTVVVLNFDGDK